jgi:hypothetical protein
MPKQGELAEVADPPDLPNLHRASKHITDGAHFSGAIGPQFRRLSRKSHKPIPVAPMIIGERQAGICRSKSLSWVIEKYSEAD